MYLDSKHFVLSFKVFRTVVRSVVNGIYEWICMVTECRENVFSCRKRSISSLFHAFLRLLWLKNYYLHFIKRKGCITTSLFLLDFIIINDYCCFLYEIILIFCKYRKHFFINQKIVQENRWGKFVMTTNVLFVALMNNF